MTLLVEPSLKVSIAPSCCDVPLGSEPGTELTETLTGWGAVVAHGRRPSSLLPLKVPLGNVGVGL